MTSKTAKTNQTVQDTQQPATPRRRLILGLVIFALAAMFLVSFIYRSQNQGLQVQQRAPEHGQNGEGEAQDGASPEMKQAMMAEIGTLMQQMQERPDDVELLLELADRFMAIKSWDRAEMFLNRAMVAEPANTKVLYSLGIAAFQQDRPQQAADYFEQVIAMAPEHAHAQFNLGMLYTHFLEQPDKGKAQFERVLELETAHKELKEAANHELGNPHEHTEEGQ